MVAHFGEIPIKSCLFYDGVHSSSSVKRKHQLVCFLPSEEISKLPAVPTFSRPLKGETLQHLSAADYVATVQLTYCTLL